MPKITDDELRMLCLGIVLGAGVKPVISKDCHASFGKLKCLVVAIEEKDGKAWRSWLKARGVPLDGKAHIVDAMFSELDNRHRKSECRRLSQRLSWLANNPKEFAKAVKKAAKKAQLEQGDKDDPNAG